MYLYPLTYIIAGDIIEVPFPNVGIYHIVIGREPGYKASQRNDNFHWQLATRHNSTDLSCRALKISVRADGYICLTAIGANDIQYKLSQDSDFKTIRPGNSTIWLDPDDCRNLTVKIAGAYTFRAQSISGGSNSPLHITSLMRLG